MKLAIIFQSKDESRIVYGGTPLNVWDREQRSKRRREMFRGLIGGALVFTGCWLIIANLWAAIQIAAK